MRREAGAQHAPRSKNHAQQQHQQQRQSTQCQGPQRPQGCAELLPWCSQCCMACVCMQFIYCGRKATLHVGNVKPIGTMPEGTIICNLEEVRSAFASANCALGLAGHAWNVATLCTSEMC